MRVFSLLLLSLLLYSCCRKEEKQCPEGTSFDDFFTFPSTEGFLINNEESELDLSLSDEIIRGSYIEEWCKKDDEPPCVSRGLFIYEGHLDEYPVTLGLTIQQEPESWIEWKFLSELFERKMKVYHDPIDLSIKPGDGHYTYYSQVQLEGGTYSYVYRCSFPQSQDIKELYFSKTMGLIQLEFVMNGEVVVLHKP